MNSKMSFEEYQKTLSALPPAPKCPIEYAIGLLQGKWNTRILFELTKSNTMRFGELKKQIGQITNAVLSSTLRDLESQNLITRIQYNEIPPHVEYRLTEKGKALYPIYIEMFNWGEKYKNME